MILQVPVNNLQCLTPPFSNYRTNITAHMLPKWYSTLIRDNSYLFWHWTLTDTDRTITILAERLKSNIKPYTSEAVQLQWISCCQSGLLTESTVYYTYCAKNEPRTNGFTEDKLCYSCQSAISWLPLASFLCSAGLEWQKESRDLKIWM